MSNRNTIYFFNQTRGEILTLPVNPASLPMIEEMNVTTHNIIDFGEVAILGERRLKTIEFSSLFFDDNALPNITTTYTNILSGIINSVMTKQSTISKLQTWKDEKDLIRVVVSDYFNELMQITRFAPVIRESTEVINYSLSFIEYRNPVKSTATGSILSILASGLTARDSVRTLANTVLAKSSDDLYSIATRYTGDSANWTNIAEKNGLSIDAGIVGKVLKL